MDDLISRQAAIDAVNMLSYHADKYVVDGEQHGFCTGIAVAERQLELVPSAQRKGKWITEQIGIKLVSYRCSECGRAVWDDAGYDVIKDYPFCHCGAEMTKGEEDERIENS